MSKKMVAIQDAIGLGAHRLSEIGGKVGQPITSLGRPMQRLLELDLILRETPFGSQELQSKRRLYRIKDPFIKFWFDIVASRRSYFAQIPSNQRQKWLKENLHYFFAQAWEELCRQTVPLLTEEWGSFHFSQGSRYWQRQEPEWDLLAKATERNAWLIGEAKWTAKTPTEAWIHQTLAELKKKGLRPLKNSSYTHIEYALFVPEKPAKLELPPHTEVISAQTIIEAFSRSS